jgi:flagellar motor switch protein FliN/FliY
MTMQWQKAITELLQETKEIPLWGTAPAFPFDNFNQTLKERFEIPDLHVDSRHVDWIPAGGWREGAGAKPLVFALEAPRLAGHVFWVVSVEEMKELCFSFLLSSHPTENMKDTPLSFLKGFYRFLCLKALDTLAELEAFPGLRFTFSNQETVPDEPMFGIEASISCKGTKSFAKILVPQKTLGSFKEFFRDRGSLLSKEQAANIEVALPLVIGNSTLGHHAWKQLHIGDFLILDHCDYKPKIKRGKARLFLEGHPIALCSLRGNSLEILEYQFDKEEIVKDEEEYPEEEHEEFEEGGLDEPAEAEEGEFLEEELEEELPEEPEALSLPIEEMPALGKEIPINLCVEVARIKMSLDKVLALKPGNLIELLVGPEQGVTITANGKAIARGELLLLGEALGVKITELG